METKKWDFMDKSKWGPGQWQKEPDKMQWVDKKTGLPCLIVRGPHGALCGYVGVTKGHPYFQKSYEECDVRCHGGLTFTDFCSPDKEHGICHVIEEGEDDKVWWLGFDCAHGGDISPEYKEHFPTSHYFLTFGTYKNIVYVQKQCAHLARQLASIKKAA